MQIKPLDHKTLPFMARILDINVDDLKWRVRQTDTLVCREMLIREFCIYLPPEEMEGISRRELESLIVQTIFTQYTLKIGGIMSYDGPEEERRFGDLEKQGEEAWPDFTAAPGIPERTLCEDEGGHYERTEQAQERELDGGLFSGLKPEHRVRLLNVVGEVLAKREQAEEDAASEGES